MYPAVEPMLLCHPVQSDFAWFQPSAAYFDSLSTYNYN